VTAETLRKSTPEGRAQVDAFLSALEMTQHLSAEKLHAYQRRLLETIVRHAHAETDFYPDRLAPLLRSDGSIDWDRWTDVPVVTRRHVQDDFGPMIARRLPNLAGGGWDETSSGSTGMPVSHLSTGIQEVASAAASERFFRWHNISPDKLTVRIVATRNPEAVLPHGRLKPAWRIGHEDSVAIDLNIKTPIAEQIAFLDAKKPAYLMTYPTNFRELARAAESMGRRLSFEAVFTVGEMVSDDVRAGIQAHYGHLPLDRYGASEVGHIAATCPECDAHHIASELVLIEVVDENGKPVPPGTPGRVVATPFYSLAMPFIRYEIGDHAVLSPDPCPCGRTLPVLSRILGRTRNVFRFGDGSSVWPVLYSADLSGFVPNRQYQVVQHSMTDIEFRYVPSAENQTADLEGLTEYMREKLHPTVTVRATKMDVIPRSEGGKYEDYMNLVGVGPG
jgi:phenylacetate-CoA ligase